MRLSMKINKQARIVLTPLAITMAALMSTNIMAAPAISAPALESNVGITSTLLSGEHSRTFSLSEIQRESSNADFTVNVELESSGRQMDSPVTLQFILDVPTLGSFPLYTLTNEDMLTEQVMVPLATNQTHGSAYELFLGEDAKEALSQLSADQLATIQVQMNDTAENSDMNSDDNQAALRLMYLAQQDQPVAMPSLKKSFDNKMSIAATMQAPPPPSPTRVFFDVNRSKTYGNDKINAGYSVKAKTTYNTIGNSKIPYKADFTSPNRVYVKIFKLKKDVLTANAEAHFNAIHTNNNSYKLDFRVLGKKIFYRNKNFGTKPQTLWDKDWAKHTQFSKGTTFMVGPIPVQVEAGAKGTVGLNAKIVMKSVAELTADANAYGGMTGFASAGVNVALARAGIRANLNIIKVNQGVDASFKINPAANYARFDIEAPLTISTLDGKLSLFGERKKIKWCKKKRWLPKVPCGSSWKNIGNKTIVSWNGKKYTTKLIDKAYTF